MFKNKKVLVMGLGLHGGGVGVVKWLYGRGAKVTVTDLKSKKELSSSLALLKKYKGVIYHLGGHRDSDFSTADVVIKGPGVPADSRYLKLARKNKVRILTDMHIFLENLPKRVRVIGVTGTKGKSTSATLISKVLAQKIKTHLAGNIRKSVLEILPEVKNGDFVVLELSSFQLEDIADLKYPFDVAVLTSLFPDHLNRHKSFAKYRQAKEIIFRFQKGDGLLVANADDQNVRRSAKRAKGRVVYVREKDFAKNASMVIGKFFKIPTKVVEEALRNFKGLSGRLEKIRELNGVIFINDTTATNPGAAIFGIKAIKEKYPNRKLVVIAGGFDKGLPVHGLLETLKNLADRVILLPGTATDRILKESKGNKGWLRVKDMTEAVHKSYQLALPRRSQPTGRRRRVRLIQRGDGAAVLLSPGAASFGLFRHEFDRGDKFNEAVRKLK